MSDMTLGFVGLGRMGTPMALRLIEAGHKPVVYDTSKAAIDALVAKGAVAGTSAKDVADKATVVFTSLPTPAIVQAVALGNGGLAEGSSIKFLVELSTIGPKAAGELAAGLKTHGIEWVEAPVSGGIKGAEKGTLAVMLACSKDALDTVTPLIERLGKIFYTGEKPGLAQVAKLANNMLSAVAMVASSEALAMAAKAGLAPQTMLDILNAGSGRNSATVGKLPHVLTRGFDYGFANDLSYKDVRLCIDESEALGCPMPTGAVVRQMLAVTKAKYGDSADVTDVARIYEEWAGVTITG